MWNENRNNHCQNCRYFSNSSDDLHMGDHCDNASSYSYGRQVRLPQKEGCQNFVDASSKEEAIA